MSTTGGTAGGPGAGGQPSGKLIVDTDWKAQAQAEKERLAAAEKAKAEAAKAARPAAGAGAAGAVGAEAGMEGMGGPEGEFPPADFIEVVRMLASQALLYLGAMPDPETGRRLVSLEMAQFHIDLLTVLETKTKGNLDEKEAAVLTRFLYELRIQYVEIAKAVAKAVEQGKVSTMGPGGVGGVVTPGGLGGGGISGPGMGGGVPPLNIKGPGR